MGEDECTAREDGGAILAASADAEVEDLLRLDGYQRSGTKRAEGRWTAELGAGNGGGVLFSTAFGSGLRWG